LLTHDLIRASFVPPTAVQELRTLTQKTQAIRARACFPHTAYRKLLKDANIKITSVISDITAKSGRAVLRAVING